MYQLRFLLVLRGGETALCCRFFMNLHYVYALIYIVKCFPFYISKCMSYTNVYIDMYIHLKFHLLYVIRSNFKFNWCTLFVQVSWSQSWGVTPALLTMDLLWRWTSDPGQPLLDKIPHQLIAQISPIRYMQFCQSQVVCWSDKLLVNSRGSNWVGLWSKAMA